MCECEPTDHTHKHPTYPNPHHLPTPLSTSTQKTHLVVADALDKEERGVGLLAVPRQQRRAPRSRRVGRVEEGHARLLFWGVFGVLVEGRERLDAWRD